MAGFNVNELILDKVRSIIFTNYSNGTIIGRLTQLEDPSLQMTAEADEVVDAVGSLITKIFRVKAAKFTATNSLLSMDLLALQAGTEKQVATGTSKIIVPCEEILTVTDGKITLTNTPVGDLNTIYLLANGQLGTSYTKGAAAASESEFAITDKKITVPTGVTQGKFYVQYNYETENAVKVANNTEKFPEMVGCKIFALFRDQCDENKKYAGVIIAEKAKIDPSSIDIALTSTGKHAFDIDFMRNYCEDGSDLFSVIIPGETVA